VSYFATGGKNLGAIAPVSAANLNAPTTTDASTALAKHSTKAAHQSTVRHPDVRAGAKDKSKHHAGPRHGSHSHHSK
jgi:hypothetical protein